MVDTPDSPSSVARFTTCEDPVIHNYEICNAKRSWFESNTVFRYFLGLETGGYKISKKQAKKFIEPWRANWMNKKETIRKKDLQRLELLMIIERREKVLVKWRERWKNPKFDKKML